MGKIKWTKMLVCAAAIVATGYGLHVYLKDDASNGSSTSTEIQAIAALVQALGAIAALYVAIRISRDDRVEAVKGKRMAIVAVAQSASEFVSDVTKLVEASKTDGEVSLPLYNVFSPSIVEGYLQAIRGIPLHEVGSGEGVRAIIMFAFHLELFGKQVAVYMGGVHNAPQFSAEVIEGLSVEERRAIYGLRFQLLCKNVLQQSQLVGEYHEILVGQMRGKV